MRDAEEDLVRRGKSLGVKVEQVLVSDDGGENRQNPGKSGDNTHEGNEPSKTERQHLFTKLENVMNQSTTENQSSTPFSPEVRDFNKAMNDVVDATRSGAASTKEMADDLRAIREKLAGQNKWQGRAETIALVAGGVVVGTATIAGVTAAYRALTKPKAPVPVHEVGQPGRPLPGPAK